MLFWSVPHIHHQVWDLSDVLFLSSTGFWKLCMLLRGRSIHVKLRAEFINNFRRSVFWVGPFAPLPRHIPVFWVSLFLVFETKVESQFVPFCWTLPATLPRFETKKWEMKRGGGSKSAFSLFPWVQFHEQWGRPPFQRCMLLLIIVVHIITASWPTWALEHKEQLQGKEWEKNRDFPYCLSIRASVSCSSS